VTDETLWCVDFAEKKETKKFKDDNIL